VSKILRLDLHTHPIEALKDKMGIKGVGNINSEVAAHIVRAVKAAGLNGIAITEHNNFNHSWVASLEILDSFRHENLIILPGAEFDYGGQQFLRLFIPERYRRRITFFQGKDWFNILAHPGYYHPFDAEQVNQVNFDAVEEKSLHGEFSIAGQVSRDLRLPLVASSDAHRLEDIGLFYTELEYR